MSESLSEALASEFGTQVLGTTQIDGIECVDVSRNGAIAVLNHARESLGMNYLVDVTAVDALMLGAERPERFEIVYVLRNLDSLAELVVRVFVPENDAWAPSATGIWRAADWLEREVFDMFGIDFRDHPNMLRILTPDNFEGHALRKDFPTEGIGYRDDYPVIKRDDA